MAIESAENLNMTDSSKNVDVGFDIVKRFLNIKTKDMTNRIGKPMGIYITFDCPHTIYSSSRGAKAIEDNLSATIKNLVGTVKKSSPILVACLGNGQISADSLGQKVFDKLEITRKKDAQQAYKQSVCALSTSVLGKTGIESAEIISAVVKEIKPSFVLLVDSLATSVPKRVGLSFQLSTAGITPGSGVGGDKERIDKTVLGVPVLSIGVPTLLALNTLVYGLFKDYAEKFGRGLDEYAFRSLLAEKKMSNMVVAPKDVDALAEKASVIISNAINLALN